MENCAWILKQFGFKHILERSWKAMWPRGKSPRPNHHLDRGHSRLLGTSELLGFGCKEQTCRVIAVTQTDSDELRRTQSMINQATHEAFSSLCRWLPGFCGHTSCCNRMLWPNGRPLHVWKFWLPLLFSDQHTAGNSSSASAWDSKCDKRIQERQFHAIPVPQFLMSFLASRKDSMATGKALKSFENLGDSEIFRIILALSGVGAWGVLVEGMLRDFVTLWFVDVHGRSWMCVRVRGIGFRWF